MRRYIARRLLISVPTLLVISAVVFLVVDLAPGSPASQIPQTIPAEVRARIIEQMGVNEPALWRYLLWLRQVFMIEPLAALDATFGTAMAEGQARITSWQSRGPVMEVIAERLPQTLAVVGGGYLLGAVLALPIGIVAALRPGGLWDRGLGLVTLLGVSLPTFLTAALVSLLFAARLGWFPTAYDTTLRVTDWASLGQQVRQMALPVGVLALANAAVIGRYLRAAMQEVLPQDHVRAARARGLSEMRVVLVHVLPNALIPVVTVIALGLPTVFGGALVTETIFKVNGIGAALIGAIRASDLPMVQTIVFLFAVLVVLCNLIADVLYAALDPRLRHG